tara:strand:+ start:309 stop:848 length:540 start_codon:yes stop_codon:yes gene_type:complete
MDNEIYLKRDYQYFSSKDLLDNPLELYRAKVESDWIDYNGHMSESFYLYAFGDASDALFQYIGIDHDYRLAGKSFYTVETHINFYSEASEGEPLKFSTQLVGLDAKRLHIFHQMFHGKSGDLLATTEQMLLHVDMKKSKACEISPDVLSILEKIWASHQRLPTPLQKGRVMAIKNKLSN